MAYGIPQLRQRSIMSGFGYDQPPDMMDQGMNYGGGDMEVNMPPPPMGPVQDTPFPGMFGNAPIPSMTGSQPSMGAPAPVAPPSVNTYEPRTDTDSLRRFTNAVNSVYSPDFTDRDRLRALMDAAPEREEPSFARRMVAAGMGFRQKPEDTLKIQDSVLNNPHRLAMADWTARTEPFTKIAEIEGRQNVNERTLAGNMVNAVTQGDRIEAQRVRDEGKQSVAEKNAESTRIKAESQVVRDRAYAAKNQGAEIKEAGDRFVAFFPDGRRLDVGPSGGLDERTKLEIIGGYKVEAAKAMGAAWAQDPDGNWHRTNARDPNSPTPPPGSRPVSGTGSKAAKEDTPAEAEKRQTMEWRRLRDTDADVKAWTTIKPNGKIELKDEPKMGSWLQSDESDQKDIDSFNRARNKLYPSNESSNKGGVYTNKYGEQTPYESEEGEEFVAPDPGPGGFNVNERLNKGVGPTKEAAARLTTEAAVKAAPPPPKFQPRTEYGGPKVQGDGRTFSSDVADLWKKANEPGKAPGVETQVMTPEGIMRVPAGKVAIQDIQTGKIHQLDESKLAEALATKRYKRAK